MNEIKQKIIQCSIELFSEKGYHGTSMRDIMKASGCTQPTLYYYFLNKKTLFREVILGEFSRLINTIIIDIDTTLPIKDFYVQAVIKRKHLTEYQKKVYKLAIQAWHGMIEDQEISNKLRKWGYGLIEDREKIFAQYFSDSKRLKTFTNLLMNVFMNITEQIIMTDFDISDEEIEERFSMLFELI
ncbi:TetR/AcrR family transcriptional regulator [Wukongibacter sp. M2B1]|uniref:TetR/AcrR family transcriptional regulator n=1 Tax=Wukongibacter sp. M2B1 TaxID=3088895 RepID=UPI003D7985D8